METPLNHRIGHAAYRVPGRQGCSCIKAATSSDQTGSDGAPSQLRGYSSASSTNQTGNHHGRKQQRQRGGQAAPCRAIRFRTGARHRGGKFHRQTGGDSKGRRRRPPFPATAQSSNGKGTHGNRFPTCFHPSLSLHNPTQPQQSQTATTSNKPRQAKTESWFLRPPALQHLIPATATTRAFASSIPLPSRKAEREHRVVGRWQREELFSANLGRARGLRARGFA
jgi:hypothetical protein